MPAAPLTKCLRHAVRGRRRSRPVRWRAGVFIHTTGVLSKLLSEAVEAINPARWKAFAPPVPTSSKRSSRRAATGDAAADLLLPLSLRTNVRSATVVGMVGAGGIGVTCGKRFAVSSSSKPAP